MCAQIRQETVEVHQIQFIDNAVDVPVVMQRQVPIVQMVQKIVEVSQAQSIDMVLDLLVIMQRQVPAVQVVLKTVGVPQSQFIEKAMDLPSRQQRQVHMSRTAQKNMINPTVSKKDGRRSVNVASPRATAKGSWGLVEVVRVIPRELEKPSGERATVRERIKQFEMDGGVSRTSAVGVTRTNPDDKQSEDPEDEAPHKRRKQESDPNPHALVHFSHATAPPLRNEVGG